MPPTHQKPPLPWPKNDFEKTYFVTNSYEELKIVMITEKQMKYILARCQRQGFMIGESGLSLESPRR